jgi:hypothetical protein
MSASPPTPPTGKRKVAIVIVIVWACIATLILLVMLISYLDREGIVMFRKNGRTQYFYPSDLKTMNLPAWQVTNTIPLAPDEAVLAAMRYASAEHPNVTTWDVDNIELQPEPGTTVWFYRISLTDRKSGQYSFEVVSVLMNGTVWTPSAERPKQ